MGAFIYGTDYSVTGRQIELKIAPASGHTLTVYRETPTDRLVSFAEGSVLKATDLSINQVQTIHVLEETTDSIYLTTMSQNSDGQWDGQEKRIVNVRDPLNPQDVVTYQFLKTYASFGDTGLDPEDIKRLLTGVTEAQEAIVILEAALEKVRQAIPTKVSQLNNDDYTVKDEVYIHTDNNFTTEHRQKLEGIKEVKRIEFSDISPDWSESNVLTIKLDPDNTFLALYRKTIAGVDYQIDTVTPCKITDDIVTITAPEKFNGYILVTGSVVYGSLDELLSLILNEEADHTYTLEEILGIPYKDPVYPNAAELAALKASIDTAITALRTHFQDNIVQQFEAIDQCRDFYNVLYTMYGSGLRLDTYALKEDLNTLRSDVSKAYALKTALDSYLTKVAFDSTLNTLTEVVNKVTAMEGKLPSAPTSSLNLTYNNSAASYPQTTKYTVMNGFCIANFAFKPSGNLTGDTKLISGLPKAALTVTTSIPCSSDGNTTIPAAMAFVDTNGEFYIKNAQSGNYYYGSITYPIKIGG